MASGKQFCVLHVCACYQLIFCFVLAILKMSGQYLHCIHSGTSKTMCYLLFPLLYAFLGAP